MGGRVDCEGECKTGGVDCDKGPQVRWSECVGERKMQEGGVRSPAGRRRKKHEHQELDEEFGEPQRKLEDEKLDDTRVGKNLFVLGMKVVVVVVVGLELLLVVLV